MNGAKPDLSESAEAAPPADGNDTVLGIADVEINEHCLGRRWTVANLNVLARIIAIIAMGQAAHAAQIIAELLPAEPAIDDAGLRADARQALSIHGDTDKARKASQYQRDGLIFEAISWAAAQQETNGKALLRDPHIKSTTQGLDGLMIELEDKLLTIRRATIFEDKCSENPRRVFRDEIMPTFQSYHKNSRASELLASAATLLKESGLNGKEAIEAAARVLDREYRAYRGSLATTREDDSKERRHRLFDGYDKLDGIAASQRIGGVLITSDNLRTWFDDLAARAISYVDELEMGES